MKQLTLVSEPKYSKRRQAGKCTVNRCKNNAKGRMCYKHKRQHQKINNPLRYWFDVLRQNARSRKIPFSLKIEEFAVFCEETNYLKLKGKSSNSMSIDRIRQDEGYKKGNLQLLTLSQNSRKYWIDLKIRFGYYPTQEELDEFFLGEVDNACIPEVAEVKVNNDEIPF